MRCSSRYCDAVTVLTVNACVCECTVTSAPENGSGGGGGALLCTNVSSTWRQLPWQPHRCSCACVFFSFLFFLSLSPPSLSAFPHSTVLATDEWAYVCVCECEQEKEREWIASWASKGQTESVGVSQFAYLCTILCCFVVNSAHTENHKKNKWFLNTRMMYSFNRKSVERWTFTQLLQDSLH